MKEGKPSFLKIAFALGFCAVTAIAPLARAEQVKIGLVRIPANAPLYIAQEKGYFRAEGIEAELVPFDAAQPIAVAVASGDIDYGSTALTVAFFSLAGQGVLRIIAAQSPEAPGFQNFAWVVGSRAYGSGLRSFKDFGGHTIAITTFGSPQHYNVGLIAAKYGLDLRTMRLLPLQTIANNISAVIGGQADAGQFPSTAVPGAVQRGEVKLLGWVGDETPWQSGVIFTATKTADGKHESVERFLRAYRKGTHDYHEAFTGADGKRANGASAPEILGIIAKYTGQPAEQVTLGISYVDADARLDARDILRQIDWYKSQDLLKGETSGAALIDKRYAVALPEP